MALYCLLVVAIVDESKILVHRVYTVTVTSGVTEMIFGVHI